MFKQLALEALERIVTGFLVGSGGALGVLLVMAAWEYSW